MHIQSFSHLARRFSSSRLQMLVIACVAASSVAVGCTTTTSTGDGGDGGSGSESEASVTSSSAKATTSITSVTSGGPTPCSGTEHHCADATTLNECKNGTFTPVPCTQSCNDIGFTSTGCSADQCQCGDPATDPVCENGVKAFCACAGAAGSACTNDEGTNLYEKCHTNDPSTAPTMKCFGNYVSGTQVDCQSAASACLN